MSPCLLPMLNAVLLRMNIVTEYYVLVYGDNYMLLMKDICSTYKDNNQQMTLPRIQQANLEIDRTIYYL